ncbi:hypothetical protein DFJ63DRAFT_154434 [Scheffersomyces coipomensis]|uniref:uncharacterized protein n=1 Tax=Scheffersomyces coipomensis TaxID=1788519 RepID=UPI00315DF623
MQTRVSNLYRVRNRMGKSEDLRSGRIILKWKGGMDGKTIVFYKYIIISLSFIVSFIYISTNLSMCRSSDRNRNQKEDTPVSNSSAKNDEEMEKLIANIEDFKRNFSTVTKSIFNLTSDSLTQFNDIAKDYSFNWLFDIDRDDRGNEEQLRKHLKSLFSKENNNAVIEEFEEKTFNYPSQYEVRNSWKSSNEVETVDEDSKFNPFAKGGIHNFFHGNYSSGKSPFGYYSYKTPSIRYYNNCINKDGESVWDSRGYWRCLFPNSEVPVELLNYKQEKLSDKILTKEDFRNAIQEKGISETNGAIDLGEKGVYFKKFEDYLNWKSIMFENVRNDRSRRRERFRKRIEEKAEKLFPSSSSPVTNEKDVIDFSTQVEVPKIDTKKVTSTIVTSFSRTNPDTKEIEYRESKKEYFNDGTSIMTTVNKSKPIDSSDWVNVNESVERSGAGITSSFKSKSSDAKVVAPSEDSTSNGGWFWNSSKK